MPLVTVNSMIRGNYSSIVLTIMHLTNPVKPVLRLRNLQDIMVISGKIPADLQNGPVTFSPDMKSMVATVIEYDKEKTTVEIGKPEATSFPYKVVLLCAKEQEETIHEVCSGFSTGRDVFVCPPLPV